MSEVRLQKILARSGAGSRRACEKLIEAGRVTVNGRVAQLGQSADASVDDVRLDGKRITLPDERVVIALNKPCGYLSAMSDDRGRCCASELLPLERWPSLFHVGRLDADTSGLLLFTTDGDLGQALAHPSHEVQKEYVACVKGRVDEASLQRLREGVVLDDGPTAPAAAELLSCDGGVSCVRLRIHEGRNRQVRRMMDAVGHPVRRLERTAIGGVRLEGIPQGGWRLLAADEVERLFSA